MNINNWLAASAGIVSGMFFTGMALAASLPYTGGIALEKTEALARTSIPLPDGKPDALLALAMRHGSAKGISAAVLRLPSNRNSGRTYLFLSRRSEWKKLKTNPDATGFA
ncbi:TPA: hypothetical protein ACKJ12_000572 [Neisseria gonorrhoeae]